MKVENRPVRRALLSVAAIVAGLSFPVGAEQPVPYELLPGSMLVDDCWDCNRIPIVRSLAGEFLLESMPSIPEIAAYRIAGISFRDPGGEYKVTGEGFYRQMLVKGGHDMELEVAVNGVGGIALASGGAALKAPWPVIEIEVAEQTRRDPAHRYTIRLVAAPRPPQRQRYRIVDGSYFIDDCPVCGRPTIGPFPIVGTFFLGLVESGANPIVTYSVTDLDANPEADGLFYRITGGGYYQYGGEVALIQAMRLNLQVNEDRATVACDRQPPVAGWPGIEIKLEHEGEPTPSAYTLYLVGKPEGPPENLFRRGDSNADGKLDIADAIYTLSYLFRQEAAPPCFDAADANGEGGVNIADAVAFLSHLFAGAGPLPAPFPYCGADPNADDVPCDSYPPCEGP